jgi:V8-like Glu-specific endopeptidase
MDEGQLIGGTAAGQRYAAVGALADETNGTFCTATLVTKNVIVTAMYRMYRKFKPPFFLSGAIAPNPRAVKRTCV